MVPQLNGKFYEVITDYGPTSTSARSQRGKRSSKNIASYLLLTVSILVILVVGVSGEAAASGKSLKGGNTKRSEQKNGCTFGGGEPTEVEKDVKEDGPFKRYHSFIYGGKTCCGYGVSGVELSDNLISSTGASMRGLFNYCGQCAETWELLFFAAACSPHQSSFLKLVGNDTKQYTLFITPELARSLWESCKEDDELTASHGIHGRPLKYVYSDESKYPGVTWATHDLKAKFFVEDEVMAHTPAIYLAEATPVSFRCDLIFKRRILL
jgi:hypothetical protein